MESIPAPAVLTITSSVSTNVQSSARAASRPTVLFPEPEKPTR